MVRQFGSPGFAPTVSSRPAASEAGVVPVLDFDPASPDGMEYLLGALDQEHQRLEQELRRSAGQLISSLRLSLGRLEIEDPEHSSLIRGIQEITGEIEREIRSFLH